MTDFFFICSIKSPQCTDKYSQKKFFHSDFPFPCFDVPKASNFTSGGVQNRKTKNRGLGTIVTSIQGSKPREKQISPTFSYFLINNALLYYFHHPKKYQLYKILMKYALFVRPPKNKPMGQLLLHLQVSLAI